MKKNLIAFLFGESQVDDEIAGIVESIADMDTDGAGDLKVEKKPLATALSALGIEDKTLENDPRGLSLVFGNAEEYRAAHAILNEPDSLHKLAELGWVASPCGDVAMANEPAELRIRFLEIDNVEAYDTKATYSASDKARLNKVKEIIKKGREFATEEPDFDDDECNPVDHSDPKKGAKDKGVGSAKDGSDPDGKPKGSEGSPSAGKSGSAPGKGGLTQPKEGDKAKLVKEGKAYCKYCGSTAHTSDNCPQGFAGRGRKRAGKVKEDFDNAEYSDNAEFLRQSGVLHAEGCECHDCQSDPIGISSAASRGPGPAWPHMREVEARVRPEVDAIHKPHDQTAALLAAHGFAEALPDGVRPGGYVARFSDGTFVPKSGLQPVSGSQNAYVFPSVMDAHQYMSHAYHPKYKTIPEGHLDWEIIPAGSADYRVEAGHASGCQCGFCKNKGNIADWNKRKKGGKKADKPEAEVKESATNIVNSMLEGNPGTPAGILGTKSFKTMKVPGGHKDRGFKPAKGMVQAAPEGSIVAKQTKPNRSA